jgi:hypothetical protein
VFEEEGVSGETTFTTVAAGTRALNDIDESEEGEEEERSSRITGGDTLLSVLVSLLLSLALRIFFAAMLEVG